MPLQCLCNAYELKCRCNSRMLKKLQKQWIPAKLLVSGWIWTSSCQFFISFELSQSTGKHRETPNNSSPPHGSHQVSQASFQALQFFFGLRLAHTSINYATCVFFAVTQLSSKGAKSLWHDEIKRGKHFHLMGYSLKMSETKEPGTLAIDFFLTKRR